MYAITFVGNKDQEIKWGWKDYRKRSGSMVNVPVGISEYELNNLILEDYKSSMPTIEEIERELKD